MQPNSSSPNTVREIAAIIGALLALYPQSDETPEVRQMILRTWVEDFIEFDPAVVAETAREWRRGHKWRPTIAELRELCHEGQANANRRRDRALPKPAVRVAEPERWIVDLWPGGMAARRRSLVDIEVRLIRAEIWRDRTLPDAVDAHLRRRSYPPWIDPAEVRRAYWEVETRRAPPPSEAAE